jgi:hypothetical protein
MLGMYLQEHLWGYINCTFTGGFWNWVWISVLHSRYQSPLLVSTIHGIRINPSTRYESEYRINGAERTVKVIRTSDDILEMGQRQVIFFGVFREREGREEIVIGSS